MTTEQTFEETLKDDWRKDVLKRTLRDRGIQFDENATTKELRHTLKTAPFDPWFDMYGSRSLSRGD